MRERRDLLDDDRAVSSAVTHALALGITAILVSGLLLSANTVFTDQRENSAREQLRTVGNRIADDLARASMLAQDGGNVTIRARHPTSVAGRPYVVTFLTGGDCDTDLFTTEACLDLSLQGTNTDVQVPVRNETAVSFRAGAGGAFTIEAVANDSAGPPAASPPRVGPNVGIGSDFGTFSAGSSVNLTNRDPVSGFTFTPGQPTVDSIIRFENDTKDLDGVITSYEWDFDGDGTTDRTGKVIDHNFAVPGKYTVTLTVTDDDGESDSVSKVISVGGLVYEHDASPENVSGGIQDGAVYFNVTNEHSSPIEINEVLIDPLTEAGSGGPDRLDSGGIPDEIVIAGDNAVGGYDGGENLYTDGRIYDIADDGTGGANLSANDQAQVRLNGFENSGTKLDMDTEQVFVAVRYEVEGQFYTAQFTLDVGGAPPGGPDEPPDPAFTVSCPAAPSCTFTDSSTDPDATDVITDYRWSFGDGETGTAQNPNHVYPANGTYDVSLTVIDDEDTSSTLVTTETVGTPSPFLVFAVNSGGPERTIDGTTYEWDTASNPHPFLSGDDDYQGSTTDGITNTTPGEEVLYQTARNGEDPVTCAWWEWWCDEEPPGSFGYDVPIPDGQYAVTFHFAEIDSTVNSGDRAMEISLEGDIVLDNYDVYDRVEDDHALYVTRTVTVSDGELNIDVDPDSNQEPPMVNAIVVEQMWAEAYQEDADNVSMEAEEYMRVVPGTGSMSGDSWTESSDGDASNDTDLVAGTGTTDNVGDSEEGERLDYYVNFDSDDTYYVWVRMKCQGSSSNAVHVGLDGVPQSYGGSGLDSNSTDVCGAGSGWMWASSVGGARVTLDPTTTGDHTVNVWMKEDGIEIDKIVLAKSAAYHPTDDGLEGPAQSPVG